jgi:hypothetical protein
MMKLYLPLWELLARGAAMFAIAAFMIYGQSLKRRLRNEVSARKQVAAVLPPSTRCLEHRTTPLLDARALSSTRFGQNHELVRQRMRLRESDRCAQRSLWPARTDSFNPRRSSHER